MTGSMSDPDEQAELFPISSGPEGPRAINDRCLLRTEDGRRMVVISGIVLAHYAVGDRIAEAHARVNLVEQRWADQNDVARAFDCSARTVRRDEQRFEDGGMAALGQACGYPQGGLRGATLAASRGDGRVSRSREAWSGSRERAIPTARSRAGLVSARGPCASGCDGWAGRIRNLDRSPCWSRQRPRRPPRRGADQTCPLFA